MPRARRLSSAFYARPTLEVIEELIGKVLVHTVAGRAASGIIVEAEAYVGEDDPACHAAPGPTRRNAPLYGPPGRAYVYFNYGMHYLVNAVTEAAGTPAAILIRALEPLEGKDLMRRRRENRRRRTQTRARARSSTTIADADLCRGPGNLTVALAINLRQNSVDLTRGPLGIEDRGIRVDQIEWSPRIGIQVGKDRQWRCAWAGHPSESGRRGQ